MIVILLLAGSLILNKGDFTYALDDPYIHMSMAKNLVSHGNWAVNQMDFTSASSSPMWVLLLSAIYYVSGINIAAPFVLNLFFQILIIISAYFTLRNYSVKRFFVPLLLAIIFISAMPAILFTGMEHSAQIVFALLFVFLSVKLISGERDYSKTAKYLLIVTPVFTAIRYEDLFPVLVVSVLLVFRKKVFYAILIVLASLLPLVIYGEISVSHGWLFLPNTLLLKSTPPGFSFVEILRFLFKAFKNITEPHIFLELALISVLYMLNYRKQEKFWSERQLFLLIAALSAIIGMSMIEYHQNGAFYRYEAYIMAMGGIAIAVNIYDYLPGIFSIISEKSNLLSKYTVLFLVLVTLSPFVMRALRVVEIPEATKEYHSQQYQMAQFVKDYAKDMNVAANDIGMLSYYCDNKIVDLWGVANIDIAKKKLNKSYDKNSISELSQKENVRLAIIYEHWFDEYGGLPASWKKIAEWTMNGQNFFLGEATVSFYAMNPMDEILLKKGLTEYSLQLPKSVTYKIF